ncbi:helix-turn-helix domain-containing protein [Chitinophaga vietnamensis]|uniref:helix-turn-helix domain-containing protein n=1 Tax=Chitinophaga vietnamensis TaxID=2593957 RepID=UPI001178C1A1|nr:helix-turn-helix transcriptional regulator [Chitinophaga vietnamensis]
MIAATIKRLRMERNLTQEYIAQELDISQNAYCKLENGQVNITIDRLEKIAGILGTPLATLLCCTEATVNDNAIWQEMRSVIGILHEELQAKQKTVDSLLEVIQTLRANRL